MLTTHKKNLTMELKKKAPRFLLESRTLAGSVIAIVIFSIIFMLIYGPYSSTSWLTLLADHTECVGPFAGFQVVMASVAFYFVAIAFLILSKVILYHVGHKFQLYKAHLISWIGAEIMMISFIYTIFTALFNLAIPSEFFAIWGRSVLVLSFIIIVPYIICMQQAVNRHQRALLDRIGMNVVNDKTDNADPKLIHLVDSTGRLKMSVNIDSLYYIESQDNYVKIYYEADGKLCGYIYVVRRLRAQDNDNTPLPTNAWINGFGVLEDAPEETAALLFAAAEAFAAKHGVTKLSATPYSPFYFTQGFDSKYETRYIEMFERAGYIAQPESYARDIDLLSWIEPDELRMARAAAEADGFGFGSLSDELLVPYG